MSSTQPPTGTDATTSTYTVAAVREAIDDVVGRWMDAYAAGDAAGVATCYTPDAQLLPVNSDVVAGTGAIAAFWSTVMEMGVARIRLETVEVEPAGEIAVEVGRYALLGADGGAVDNGKYMVLWRRDGGRWKLHRDIWTTSRPAA